MKLSLPRGYRRLRVGSVKRKGDKFMNYDGEWIATSDAGYKVTGDYPQNPHFPKYSGVYIRRIK